MQHSDGMTSLQARFFGLGIAALASASLVMANPAVALAEEDGSAGEDALAAKTAVQEEGASEQVEQDSEWDAAQDGETQEEVPDDSQQEDDLSAASEDAAGEGAGIAETTDPDEQDEPAVEQEASGAATEQNATEEPEEAEVPANETGAEPEQQGEVEQVAASATAASTPAQKAAAATVTAASPSKASPDSASATTANPHWSVDGLYYYDASGKKVTGFKTISGKDYFFDANGKLQKGRVITPAASGKKTTYYYATADGTLLKGDYLTDGKGRIFVADKNGHLAALKDLTKKRGFRWLKNYGGSGTKERYYLYRSKNGVYYAKLGYSTDTYAHFTRPEGYVVRGAYLTKEKKGARIYLADGNGRAATLASGASKGWVTTKAWGASKKRTYYLVRASSGANKGAYFAKYGYSTAGGRAHITTKGGYIRTSSLKKGERIYVVNKKGVVAKLTGGKERGWLSSSDFVSGSQRYYLQLDTKGIYKGAYYAVRGYQTKKQSGTYAHYTNANGTVKRSEAFQMGETFYYADAKGKVTKAAMLDGVDIFSGDGEKNINIAKLKAQFVIVKVTQGTNYKKNPFWEKHAKAVLKANKLLGFYHYASSDCGGGSAKKQADYFVKTIKSSKANFIGKAALVLDWENNGDNDYFDGSGNTKAAVSWAKGFLDRVKSTTGVSPMIYMSRSVAESSNWKPVSDAGYDLWMAQYLYKYYNGSDTAHVNYQANPAGVTTTTKVGTWASPNTKNTGKGRLAIYQYTSEGRDPGFAYALDINKFYGTRADWAKLCTVSKATK